VVLVLDDYHVLDARPIDQALAVLVEHLPPQLHLVIVTREHPPLPLARLRTHDQLSELRVADLRFASDEAATFLNQLVLATRTYRRVLDLAGDPPDPIACEAYLGLARIAYQWGDRDAARQHGRQCL
jgi:ATP/maltotriose-dependent transcriptional regulator MalT